MTLLEEASKDVREMVMEATIIINDSKASDSHKKDMMPAVIKTLSDSMNTRRISAELQRLNQIVYNM